MLKELEEAAKAATPGPWCAIHLQEKITIGTKEIGAVCRIQNIVSGRPLEDIDYTNGNYIAAANPETILRLIELVREMGEVLEETTGLCENYQSVEEDNGYRFTEADAVIQQGREALAKYKELTK